MVVLIVDLDSRMAGVDCDPNLTLHSTPIFTGKFRPVTVTPVLGVRFHGQLTGFTSISSQVGRYWKVLGTLLVPSRMLIICWKVFCQKAGGILHLTFSLSTCTQSVTTSPMRHQR